MWNKLSAAQLVVGIYSSISKSVDVCSDEFLLASCLFFLFLNIFRTLKYDDASADGIKLVII